jgi:glycine cleavage system protein P-like pyridoxal-binding family
MKKITPTLKVLAVAAAFLVLAGCNSLSRTTESSSLIVIQSITGTTTAGDTVAYLQSDVQAAGGIVTVDNATANIIVRLVNPDPINGPSQFNDVVLTNYRVTYELPAGPGTPGTDVPLPFDGNFSTVLCSVDKETSVPFVVVLEAAKLAAPLSGLVGTTTVLERKAKIEIFGHDLTDHPVTATGYLTIYFADYANVVPIKK